MPRPSDVLGPKPQPGNPGSDPSVWRAEVLADADAGGALVKVPAYSADHAYGPVPVEAHGADYPLAGDTAFVAFVHAEQDPVVVCWVSA